ncbi:hypothetical protein SXCC_03646 [Gluconacetobacter sp. SXCC-1]|nr:hypothetical protein SXCC_03646 [Gluconacetobacter sp. SXCC-1]
MAKDLFLSWTNAVMQVIENTTVFYGVAKYAANGSRKRDRTRA